MADMNDPTAGMTREQLYDHHLNRLRLALDGHGITERDLVEIIWRLFKLLRPDDIAAATGEKIAAGVISTTLHVLTNAMGRAGERKSPVQVPDTDEPEAGGIDGFPVQQARGHGD